MGTVLITGCNRGIGLELCRLYRNRGEHVIGACRETNDALDALGIDTIDGVDVATASGVNRLATAVADRPIDVLVNNAGILHGDSIGTVDFEQMQTHFAVNTLGPLRVTLAMRENLRRDAKVAIVTSRVGSIADNSSGGNYAYRVSKTAVNMVGANLTHDLRIDGISVVLLHPGYVTTDMTGGSGNIGPAESAAGLIARIDKLTPENSGKFWHAEGYELPW